MFEGNEVAETVLEDANFLVAAKPPGIESVSPDGSGGLIGALRTARGEPDLTPVHRLDRDTSGALLVARNAAAAQELAGLFRRRRIAKTYIAICLGVPRNERGEINRNLSEWAGGRRPVRILKRGGLEASTAYRVLAASGRSAPGLRVSLIAFCPRQGRTHQIRVHAAGFGYPVLGDDRYGDRAANAAAGKTLGLKRQALHSLRLAFAWRGNATAAFCPPFADIERALELAFGAAPGALVRENLPEMP